jgi:hypothetical protein
LLDQKQLDHLFKKVQRLKQCDEVWAGTCRLARMWITPKNAPPYRPYVALLLNHKNKILRFQVLEQPPTTEQLLEVLVRAMRRPMLGSGWRARRPISVYLDNADYVAALIPRLAELDVGCEYRTSLPAVDDALYSMATGMGRYELIPGLLSIPSITPPLLGQLYTLTTQFYQATPWRRLNDQHPLEIRYPPDSKPRYGVVMGSGGEVVGLAVYDTLDDLRLMYRRDLSPQQTSRMATWLVLFFEEAPAMSFDDLDAMARYNWPVANQQSYPVFGRTTSKPELVLPTATDLFWMEGALTGILAFLSDHMRPDYGFVQPAEITLPITTLSGKAQIYLRLPAIEAGMDDAIYIQSG